MLYFSLSPHVGVRTLELRSFIVYDIAGKLSRPISTYTNITHTHVASWGTIQNIGN